MPAESNLQLEIGHVLLLDIVGYSKLLMDEQRESLRTLNDLVLQIGQSIAGDAERPPLRLPTGDGMALVFSTTPDAPVRCAVELARALASRPEIPVRMGIHSGPVSSIADVNERLNFAGAGLNIAQRVMDCGDAGHILLSERVAGDLAQFREWQGRLHDLGLVEVKHGVKVHAFNLYGEDFGNPARPAKFKSTGWPVTKTISRHARKAGLIAGLAGVALFAVVLLPRMRHSQVQVAEREKSIAVLPFADLSAAKDQEYFCDGISEELLDALAKVEGLRVVARTSSFSFKGKNADVGEIGRQLGVANVLEGSLRREGNRIRVTAQLIDARNGFHIWSETFERELQGVFAVQDEITRKIVDALKVKLAVAPATRGRQNTEAYDLYLQGLYYSNKSTEEGLRQSLEFFQRSLDVDPNSARAWAGVAKAWTWLADAYVKPLEAYPAVKAAALKAVALDETEPEGHVYVAEFKRVLDWDVTGAVTELKRALQLEPNSANAHLFLALADASDGKPETSTAHIRAALKADPLSPIISHFATLLFVSYADLDAAIAEGKRTQQLDPNYIYGFPALAVAYHEKGMFPEAIALYQKAQEITGQPQAGLAVTYAAIGRVAEARQILHQLEEMTTRTYLRGEDMALVHAALGENAEALHWLERACDERSGSIHSIAVRPGFASLHSEPRFAAVLKRIGLNPAAVLHGHSSAMKPRS